MSKIRKINKKEGTRLLIHNAIIHICTHCELKDISNVTITEICEQAGIARSTYYYYYNDIHSLIKEMEGEILSGMKISKIVYLAEDYSNIRDEKILHIYNLCVFFKERLDYLKILMGPKGDPSFVYKMKKSICKAFIQKLENDQIKCDNIELCASFVSGGFLNLLEYWIFENNDISAYDISRISGKMIYANFYDINI